jgi:hypothetical protein
MMFDYLYVTCFLPVLFVNVILLLQHSKNGRKTHKKSKKGTKTKRIRSEQFFPKQVNQDNYIPVSNVARRKTKNVKPNSMPLPTTGSKTQNVERRKVKTTGKKTRQYQSYDDERKVRNQVSDANLVSKRKRRLPVLSDSGSAQCKKKRRKICPQNDVSLPGNSVSNTPVGSGQGEVAEQNWKNQSQREHKKGMNSKTENCETLGSTRRSLYSIHKLKQMIEASDAKELSKERIAERKRVKGTESLRERMFKRLQASRFR